MATLVFTNARVLIRHDDVSGDLNQCTLEYTAETPDATTFGVGTRVNKSGGLMVSRLSVRGFIEFGPGQSDETLFNRVGVEDDVVTVWPNSITEGSTGAGSGYGFKALTANYSPGGQVGDMLGFTATAMSRGVA